MTEVSLEIRQQWHINLKSAAGKIWLARKKTKKQKQKQKQTKKPNKQTEKTPKKPNTLNDALFILASHEDYSVH